MIHRIDIAPARRGKSGIAYVASFQGEIIGSTPNPIFVAARWLLENGKAAPDDRLTTYCDDKPRFTAKVSWAAARTVRETETQGPHFVKWRPFPTRQDGISRVTGPSPDGVEMVFDTEVARDGAEAV